MPNKTDQNPKPKLDIPATPHDKFLLPVFKLQTSPVVLSPGILYKINFSNGDALTILNYFKKQAGKINNHLLKASFPDVGGKQGEAEGKELKKNEIELFKFISEDSIRSSRELKRFLNAGDTATHGENYDWLLCALLPKNESEYVTIVRIVGVTFDESNKSYVLTFQGLTRGRVSKEEVNFPKDCLTEVVTNKIIIKEPVLKGLVESFNEITQNLFGKIDHFLKFSNDEKNASLSPLFQILYLQLNNSEYGDSITKLKSLIKKFNTNFQYEEMSKNTDIYLKLLDLTIAILPISNLSFLKCLEIQDRIPKFDRLVNEFSNIFDVLETALGYVTQFNTTSTDLEKSKIISNQLKSIRHSIDVISPDLKKSNKQSREDSDLAPIVKFIGNLSQTLLPQETIASLTKDFRRLSKMPPQHSEYQVLRNYFDVVIDIPFNKFTELGEWDLDAVRKQLDDDHFGLRGVKRRVVEYVSVLKLLQDNEKKEYAKNERPSEPATTTVDEDFIISESQSNKQKPPATSRSITKHKPTKSTTRTPILLFVGPPGVGKTSLARSISTALNRQFQRISLGGIRDESEIRGHRRTYVGSLPGVIISALRKAGTMNPLILLDEIDKVCGGANSAGKVNGDPEAALLEVLDPEQNWCFTDHYLGFPVDLSQVLFLCTANDLRTISGPLRDRMEVIEIKGYGYEEKRHIASRFLLPKQIKFNGLKPGSVKIDDQIWGKLISEYVRESGVRNLERLIGSICRGKAVEFINDKDQFNGVVKEIELIKYLGLPHFPVQKSLLETPQSNISVDYGIVNGLSYNSAGVGDVLLFEVVLIPNEKLTQTKVQMTGNLGKTLIESIQIALSFIRSLLSRQLLTNFDNAALLNQLNHSELNLHVPSGGIDKDGPSAGITITLAILSALLQHKVPRSIAMTGEISLRGKVLPIGGVQEKLLGAAQYGLTEVLLPKLNERDVIEAFSESDEELMRFVLDRETSEKIIRERVEGKLGVKIKYVETFWDVLVATWSDEVKVEEVLRGHV